MWSREEALTDPSIREPLIFLSEFRFSLRDIPAEITVRLYRPIHSAKIVVRRSHDISVSGVDERRQQPQKDEGHGGRSSACRGRRTSFDLQCSPRKGIEAGRVVVEAKSTF